MYQAQERWKNFFLSWVWKFMKDYSVGLATAASPSGMLTSWTCHLQRGVAKPPQQWPYHHIDTYLINLLRLKIIALREPHLTPSSLYTGQCVYPFFIPFLSLDRVLTQALGDIASLGAHDVLQGKEQLGDKADTKNLSWERYRESGHIQERRDGQSDDNTLETCRKHISHS